MENSEQLIAIYSTGFIVCAILTAVGIALAIFFFFKFDIRNIFLLRTGKAKQQTINEMQQRNLRTGKLSSSTPYTDSGELKSKEEKRKSGPLKASRSKPVKVEMPQSPPPVNAAANAAPAGETSVLQSSGAAQETSVLQSAEAPQAVVQKPVQKFQDPLQTAMLARSDTNENPVKTSSSFKFTLTERTIIIHTTERI